MHAKVCINVMYNMIFNDLHKFVDIKNVKI